MDFIASPQGELSERTKERQSKGDTFSNATVRRRGKVVGYPTLGNVTEFTSDDGIPKEVLFSGNLHKHFPGIATFFFSKPPRANPPCFLPRDTVFPIYEMRFGILLASPQKPFLKSFKLCGHSLGNFGQRKIADREITHNSFDESHSTTKG